MEDINSRIKEIRLHYGHTQKSFAEQLGVKWYQIKDIETKKTKPSVDILMALSENFAISADWLLTGNGTLTKSDRPEVKDENAKVTTVVVEHQDLIKRFKNPQKAKEFNEFLISVEEHDPEGYDNLYGLAKTIYKSTPDGQKKETQKPSIKKQANGR